MKEQNKGYSYVDNLFSAQLKMKKNFELQKNSANQEAHSTFIFGWPKCFTSFGMFFCNTIFNSFSFGDNFQHNDYVYLKLINETHYPNLSEIKKNQPKLFAEFNWHIVLFFIKDYLSVNNCLPKIVLFL